MGSVSTTQLLDEYPPKVNLAKDVYRPFPKQPAGAATATVDDPTALVRQTLASLSTGLVAGDADAVQSLFHGTQAYWRDIVALTWHLRTLRDRARIAPALVQLAQARGLADGAFAVTPGSVNDVTVSPALRWIEGLFTFETVSPAARCGGRIVLLPEAGPDGGDGVVAWKIWTLATWIEDLVASPQDMDALRAPKRDLAAEGDAFATSVLILGGGNAGLIMAARLKAIGVDSVVVERNEQAGDNWALRYDSLRFHIAKSNCEMPYLHYPEEPETILTRKDLAEQCKRYASTFDLNILHSSWIEASAFDVATKTWHAQLHTPSGTKTVQAKHLINATGIGGTTPYVPEIPGADQYQGVNIHSVAYKNPGQLSDQGAKSVLVVGSANSAFDIMEDCAAAGLHTTMNARSPTYIFPWDYSLAPQGLGLYTAVGPELADKLQMSSPNAVAGQLAVGLHAFLAAKEPERYRALAATGFPVYDSVGGRGDLFHHLLERGGGHFNDIGEGIAYIVSGRVAVKGGVHPVAYTASGLAFSDGSAVDADAIVWCTGFRDKDRAVTAQVLGGQQLAVATATEAEAEVLGPEDVAARRDGLWGVDCEGEIRGVFKRHLRLHNYWTFGGTTAFHRFYSLPLALQIKASLDGILPEAYRDTPEVA